MRVGIGETPYIESISTSKKIQTMKQTWEFCDGQAYSSYTFLYGCSLIITILKDFDLLQGQWRLVYNIIYLRCRTKYGLFLFFLIFFCTSLF